MNTDNKKIKKTPQCPQEKINVVEKTKGVWWDDIYKKFPDGTIEKTITERKTNVVTVPLAKLVAGLMANEPSFSGGILYHMIGEGLASWDAQQAPPPPNWQLLFLENEYFRKVPDSIQYIDGNGQVSLSVTDIVRVSTTFDFGEANGKTIREQGLTGGTATTTINSGLTIDVIRHQGIPKDETVKIVRHIELLF